MGEQSTIGDKIEAARKRAGLTQQELAERVGVSQGALSKWESGQAEPPLSDLPLIAEELGVETSSLLPGGRPQRVHQATPTQYRDMDARMHLARSYLSDVDERLGDELDPGGQVRGHLKTLVTRFSRKPVLGISGASDAGKSTFLNYLLGSKLLPTAYQPMTLVPTLVMHVGNKPAYLKAEENVLVLSGCDVDGVLSSGGLPADRKAVAGVGSLAVLTTHPDQEGRPEEGGQLAVVFHDAPILEKCCLLDLPGYQATDADTMAAQRMMGLIDGLVYASPINGFINSLDVAYLGQHVARLPVIPEGSGPLDNLLILMTRCGPDVEASEVEHATRVASKRLRSHLAESVLAERERAAGAPISAEGIAARVVPFGVGSAPRQTAASRAVNSLLDTSLPKHWSSSAAASLNKVAKEGAGQMRRAAREIKVLLERDNRIKEDFERFESEVPALRLKSEQAMEDVLRLVRERRDQAAEEVGRELGELLSEGRIEHLVDVNYGNNKDEARKHVGNLLSDKIGGLAGTRLRRDSEEVAARMKAAVEGVQFSVDELHIETASFDANGLGVAAAAGLGSVGLLGTWAAAAAAGSNLGGYIAVAKIAGFLGMSSAWLVSAVAALGGPLVALVAVGVLAALIAYGIKSLFGPKWQTSLARDVAKAVRERDVHGQTMAKLRESYSQAEEAIRAVFAGIKQGIEDHRAKLRALADAPLDREALVKKAEAHRRGEAYFFGIPRWETAT